MIKKVKISWPKYLRMIDCLYDMIDWKKERFNRIVAINRGGLVIGSILSHKAKIPLIVVNDDAALPEYKRVLLVDDLSDTGATLQFFVNQLHPSRKMKTATIHKKYNTKLVPDYYVEESVHWITYPYEVE